MSRHFPFLLCYADQTLRQNRNPALRYWLGGMRFPRPQQMDEMADVVRYAHSRGINYFDTARFIATTKRRNHGRAFAALPRDSFIVRQMLAASGDELRRAWNARCNDSGFAH